MERMLTTQEEKNNCLHLVWDKAKGKEEDHYGKKYELVS